MAKVNQSSMKQWQDGQTMHGPEYNQERDLIIAATNDTQDQVDVLKGVGGVGTNQIQDNAVTTSKINNGAVTLGKLAPLSVDNTKLVDLAVTGNKIQDSTITTTKLANGIVTTEKLADNAVTTDKLAAGAVTLMKMGDNSVRTAAILNGAVITSKLADDAVDTAKILDGAVSGDKIMNGAITPDKLSDVYYTATETDNQISTALTGGLPQEVIDQIIDQVADITSGTVNTVPDDSIMAITSPSDVPLGTYVMRITEPFRQSWNDSTYFGYEDVVPVLLRTSHAGDKVVEEIFYQGPGWNVSYKRVSMSNSTWTGWRDDETTFGAQSKADAALASAKTFTQAYADEYTIPQFNAIVAGGYIPKDRPSNMLPNSSAEMGLQGWANVGSTTALFTASVDSTNAAPGVFSCLNQTTTGGQVVLQSDSFPVSGPTVTLSADFINSSGAGSQMIVRLVRVSDNAVVANLTNNATTAWHRKFITATTVTSSAYVIQIIINSGLSGASRRVRRITVASGADSDVWNQDANDKLLFQSVSDGKTAIAAAITGKGVVASGSDTHQQLATKVGQIQQGFYQLLNLNNSGSTASIPAGFIGPVYSIATIPAGTTLISLMTNHATNARLFAYANVNTSVRYAFGLVDGAGVFWQLSAGFVNSTGESVLNIQLTPTSAITVYVAAAGYIGNANETKYLYGISKPASFNMNTTMNLCLYAVTNSSSVATSATISQITNMRLASM